MIFVRELMLVLQPWWMGFEDVVQWTWMYISLMNSIYAISISKFRFSLFILILSITSAYCGLRFSSFVSANNLITYLVMWCICVSFDNNNWMFCTFIFSISNYVYAICIKFIINISVKLIQNSNETKCEIYSVECSPFSRKLCVRRNAPNFHFSNFVLHNSLELSTWVLSLWRKMGIHIPYLGTTI